jgi:hypothetical protein
MLRTTVAICNSKRMWMLLFAISVSFNKHQSGASSLQISLPKVFDSGIFAITTTNVVIFAITTSGQPTSSSIPQQHMGAAATVVSAASAAVPETNECSNRSLTVPLISNTEITKR